MAKVALALSGGGHRAALFNLGVMLYLADAGKNQEVCSIASVSGGSLTNGYVAQLTNFDRCTGPEFWQATAPLVDRLASRGTLWAWWGTWVYLGACALSVAAVVIWWRVTGWPWPAHLPTALLALLAIAKLLVAKRGVVCGKAFAATLFSPTGSATMLLNTANGSVDHVFCATELHAGEHLYFSGNFVCSYRLGWGHPANLPLHVAVQASAAFPGAFPPRTLSTARHSFHDGRHFAQWMLLLDGGVYDNMADQWPMGIAQRKNRWPEHAEALVEPDEVIVVNACANLPWGSVRRLFIPILNEILSLKRAIDVLYDNTTAPRRRFLVDRFDNAAQTGGRPQGALVTLEQTPFQVAAYFATQTVTWPDRAQRAKAVLAALGDTEDAWNDTVGRNCAVPTTLSAVGQETAGRLLRHAYTTAMMNLHVILDYPLLAIPPIDRFAQHRAPRPSGIE